LKEFFTLIPVTFVVGWIVEINKFHAEMYLILFTEERISNPRKELWIPITLIIIIIIIIIIA